MNIEAMDLNLLVGFEALFLERTVTGAARRIGLSQPAMSNSLARLRRTLSDPLFVRSGQQMVPTVRARDLSGPILDALNRIRVGIRERPAFQPSKAERSFTIATTDSLECTLLPELLRGLQLNAPGISIRVHRAQRIFEFPLEQLHQCDFALGSFPRPLAVGAGINAAALFKERYVGVIRRDHRLAARRRFGIREFLALRHIRVNYGQSRPGIIDDSLARRGYSRRVCLTVPHQSTILFITAQSDSLGIVPERLAQFAAASLKLRIVELPLKLPPLTVTLAWEQRRDNDPAHRWFREFAIEQARGLGKMSSRTLNRRQ